MKLRQAALATCLALAALPSFADGYYHFDGTGDGMEGTFATTYDEPFTVFVWMRLSAHPIAFKALVMVGSAGSLLNSHDMRTNNVDNAWQCHSNDGAGSGASATVTGADRDNLWTPWICEFNASNDRRNLFDAATEVTSTGSRTVAAWDDISVGRNLFGTQEFSGDIAYVTVWDVLLGDADEASLLAGTCPNTIDNSNRIAYYPLQASSSTQANEGLDTQGDLAVTNATFNASGGPGLSCGGGSPPPTFDDAPHITARTATQYTATYDTANAANFFLGVYLVNAPTPTCDNLEAGTGTGFIANATEAATNSPDTLSVTVPGGDPAALHDVYGCAEDSGGTQDSIVEPMLDEMLAAPSGRQYVIKSGEPGGQQIALFTGASPAIVDGDVQDVSALSDSFALGAGAHVITVNANTTFTIAAGGDTSRQLLTRRFYDNSLQAWSDGAPVALAINNGGGTFVCSDPGDEDLIFAKDEVQNFPLDDCWNDAEGDSQTHSITNLPAAASVTGGETLTGAFTSYGIFTTPIFVVTDQYNKVTSKTATISVGARIPDVISLNLQKTLERTLLAMFGP